MPDFMFEAEFWVAVAFVIVVGGLVWKGRGALIQALDERAAKIAADLDEARHLHEEAKERLAEYQRKQRDALKEAEAIVAQAKAEAERIAADAKTKMEDFVARRTKTAESKIAMAEAQALADVRAAAADAAVQAASTILSQSVKGSVSDDLLTKGIAEVRQKLN